MSIHEVPQLIADLYKTTKRLETIFVGRPFTPDGHLLGSIGEVVAEYIYGLSLEDCSTPQVDATTSDGRSVQIKLTGKSGKSYGLRWSNARTTKPPDLLIGLKLTNSGFKEIYNGPFPVDLLKDRPESTNGQLSISVSKLSPRNPKSLPQPNSLEEFNEPFIQKVGNE